MSEKLSPEKPSKRQVPSPNRSIPSQEVQKILIDPSLVDPQQQTGPSQERFSQQQSGSPRKRFARREFSWEKLIQQQKERFLQQQPGPSQERFPREQPESSRAGFSKPSVASLLPPARPSRQHTFQNIRPIMDEDDLYMLRRNITLSEMLLRREPLFVDAPLPTIADDMDWSPLQEKQRKPFQEKPQEENKQEPHHR